MAVVHLAKPDLALFADPGSTLVQIPHLMVATRTRTRAKAGVLFEGDSAPTWFRGASGKAQRSYALQCRYSAREHDEMWALLDLLEMAEIAADGRLQLRLNHFDVPDLQSFEVVHASDVTEPHVSGRVWDVTFTVTTAQYSLVAAA